MKILFHKMHGTLNDFVVFDDLENATSLTSEQVERICNRRGGVGADGVIVVRHSDAADFFMDYINADGSIAEMCGNGIRCLAKYVYDNGLTDQKHLTVETRAGIKQLELFPDVQNKIEAVQVDMGFPIFDPAQIPANIEANGSKMIEHDVQSHDRNFPAAILSMGNPHCVIILNEDIESLPARYGPAIEQHSLFPAKTNVEFVRVLAPNRILMRVWERGSGETFSCGTGACASAIAARVKGLVDSTVMVELLGGTLTVEWKGMGNPILMKGPAVTSFKGSITT